MDSTENKKLNPRQSQNENDYVESATQNDTPQDQVNRSEEDNHDQDNEEDTSEQSGDKYSQDFQQQEDASRDLSNIDYTNYTRQKLVDRLKELIDSDNISNIRKEVDIIKATFYKKQQTDSEETQEKPISEESDAEASISEKDPLEEELKELLKRYKERKAEINKQIEEEKRKNLREKYKIIDELKNLINKKESMDQTYKEFRELQRRWKESGPVPQKKIKVLWATYQHHVERFYDYVKINKELKDLDLKKNLEAKLDLCEKAEKLKEEDNIVHASNTLQHYHQQWREIGPVPNEKREEIWERFK
ncbi:MAG: DUF349 domain-containing protein, partial [Bacteroidota bacterium]